VEKKLYYDEQVGFSTKHCLYSYSMDKLGMVRETLAMADGKWEEWKLEELTESLRKYVERNPLQT
jgi:hypothetical protein